MQTHSSPRPAPPPLDLRPPDCSVCGLETDASPDGTYECEHCGISWSAEFPGLPGEWDEPEADRCPATAQPFTDKTNLPDGIRWRTYQCVLASEHDGEWHHGLYDEGHGFTDTHDWRQPHPVEWAVLHPSITTVSQNEAPARFTHERIPGSRLVWRRTGETEWIEVHTEREHAVAQQ